MIKRIVFFIVVLIAANFTVQAQGYMFRLYLSDKGESRYSVDNPGEYLSQRSVDRRIKQNLTIDESDLPVSEDYISAIQEQGCLMVAKSKWLNTVTVYCSDSLLVGLLKDLPFIKKADFVWKGIKNSNAPLKAETRAKRFLTNDNTIYGAAYKQIAIHNGDYLHELGHRGEGMEIAVIDAGFNGLNQEHLLLSTANIKGVKDFVYKGGDIYQSSRHGTSVLSCMATNASGTYVGTAPKAGYWLLRSEDASTEFPVEEDYWVVAAEYADSLGVDLINTSLGYSKYDLPELSYTYSQIDGKTAFMTKAAEIAVSKGIFVVASAGNEGNKAWRYITVPGDGETVFTVGAVAPDSLIAAFSSRGPTYDGRIKPDVVAVGSNCAIVNAESVVTTGLGTSYASPVMCGLVACFWQANPHLTNKEIARILKESSNRYAFPDNDYGYGIPDMKKAMDIAGGSTGIKQDVLSDNGIKIISDTTAGEIFVSKQEDNNFECIINIYTIEGKLVVSDVFKEKDKKFQLAKNENSIFLVRLIYKDKAVTRKVCM